jgi:acetyl-CoA carboxylase biotin carboxyl carrier protein
MAPRKRADNQKVAKMSAKPEGNSSPFDLAQLKELFEMMEKYGLTEISLQHGEMKYRLKRGGVPMPVANMMPTSSMMPMMPAAQPAMSSAPVVQAAAQTAVSSAPVASDLIAIKSPTVGTFYSRPSPDDPIFVKVGDVIAPDKVVCLIEAMKVFNEIPAEVSGTVIKILVNNGDTVDFGQQLFLVKPA